MLVDLNKNDFISLVLGCQPTYLMFQDRKTFLYLCMFGSISASYEAWDWDIFKLETFSNDDLWNLYQLVKRK